MNIEKFECERLGNEYKSLLEQICYFLDYKSYISKVNIDKIRDLALKLETGECEIIQFKRTLCKFDVEHKIKEEVDKKGQEKDKEIKKLNNRIEKAIDFLKENACIDEDVEYFCDDLRYDDCKKLLEILKGDDKE